MSEVLKIKERKGSSHVKSCEFEPRCPLQFLNILISIPKTQNV